MNTTNMRTESTGSCANLDILHGLLSALTPAKPYFAKGIDALKTSQEAIPSHLASSLVR